MTAGCRPDSGWPGPFSLRSSPIEFSIVFWGATLIERQTGVSTEAATLLAALFLGGMFVGRLAQSAGVGTTGDIRRAAAIGVVLAGTGAAIAWVSTSAPVSGAALFLAGLGVAGLYPLGVAAALAAAPGRLTLAGTRLTLASGTAILVAPFALGVAADAAGVPVAWGLVVVLSLVALALVAVLPAGIPRDAADEAITVAHVDRLTAALPGRPPVTPRGRSPHPGRRGSPRVDFAGLIVTPSSPAPPAAACDPVRRWRPRSAAAPTPRPSRTSPRRRARRSRAAGRR